MKYKIIKKTIGVNNIITLKEFSIENKISDICYVDEIGVIYISDNYLGVIKSNGQHIEEWKGKKDEKGIKDGSCPTFSKLNSAIYMPDKKNIVLSDDYGKNIREINLDSNYTRTLLAKNTYKEWLCLNKNISESKLIFAYDKLNKFFFISTELKKCFYFNNNDITHVAGNGKCVMSFGNNLQCISIGVPNGITYNNKTLIISDQLSGSLIGLCNNKSFLLHNNCYNNVLNCPSKLCSCKNIMYILCNNGIWTYSFLSNKISQNPIYKSNNIKNMTIDQNNKSLYFLEQMEE